MQEITLKSRSEPLHAERGPVLQQIFREQRVTQTGFIAAMAAGLTYGGYECPVTVGRCQSEWIIVSTWGEKGDFLSLSLTGTTARRLGPAPRGLQPTMTHLGILLTRNSIAGKEEAEYLLIRHLPQDVAVGGTFSPSDGYVRIQRQKAVLRLTAHGRYAHCQGTFQGQSIVRDIPEPAPGYEKARAWHMTAMQRPWIGEFTPHTATKASGKIVPLATLDEES